MDHFFSRSLAAKDFIWVKERKYKAQQSESRWFAKFLHRFQEQGKPLRFNVKTANTQSDIAALIAKHSGAKLATDAQEFLAIAISRLVVREPGMSCWIDCSHRCGGGAYYVSCGIRYDSDKKDAAKTLWTEHFGPLDKVLSAPSKALVFSDVYDIERARDTSVFINHVKASSPLL